ncbi:NrfD/PsrC family molybdoenzyme membrane anchor subunit [uncultured Thiodictyon sp.]|jgi:molybdopterin-containing oxidoreductase family membrane subunit|uniref:NrfD/PsrC family molybdoenzyme membrane anchor subunit n=1 Tax=uncultured Thiodictyon sp. TaxID=1846217 RepID=UPI0025FF6E1D|nr:NrfD/PsrC family molybdoenzyme membrane anchor subunit [uncultured Thiodictyon sp.]
MNTVKTKQTGILSVALIGFLVSAGLVLDNLAQYGHAALNTNNLGISWGFPIVVYDYFLLTSTGLAMLASLAIVFGGETFRPVIKRAVWLALAGLAGGVAVLFLELGHPLRALWAIPFSFAFSSPLYWKVMCVSFYVLSLLILMARMLKSHWTIAELRINGIVTLVLALGVTSIAGVVYGSQSFRPFWASGDIPIAFIFESLLGGLAFIFFFTYLAYAFNPAALPTGVKRLFTGPLPRLLALAIFVHLLFVLARMASGLYGNLEGLQVWHHVATSPLFYAEILLGLVLPLVLLMRPGTRNNPWVQMLASFLVMNALLVSRYEYILGGQLVPMFKGAWAPALLSYFPSPTEWLMLLIAIFLSNTFNALGELFLGLSSEGDPSARVEPEPLGAQWGEGGERLAS